MRLSRDKVGCLESCEAEFMEVKTVVVARKVHTWKKVM